MKKFIVLLLLPVAVFADVVVPADKVENSVNIRLEADTTSDVVGELRKGDSLPLVGSIDGWHEVELEGDATGYISADWTRVEPDPVDEVVPEAVAAVEEVVEAEVEVAVVEETIVEEVPEAVEAEVEPVVEETVEIEIVEEVVAETPEAEPAPPEAPEPEPEPAPPPVKPLLEVDRNYVAKARKNGELGNSQIFDNGNRIGIGTDAPEQRLEVNGSIQIHDQNSSVAGLMITQASGDTGYIMHNRASTLTIGAGSIDRITIDRDGNIGFAVARPSHPLEMASGAHVTAGGVWTNRSSRQSKENIAALSPDAATAAVMGLQPVTFSYVVEEGEDYVGFIAQDVPSLLASADRESLSAMDIVAALTKVVQEQQRRIDELEARLDAR
jgi:hypothetical protein